MQKRLKTIATLAAAAFAIVGGAAPIPQEWAVEVSRVRQYQFQATHGDTMELKATFWHDGEPFDLGGETFRLYWQTNAMESVYWSAPATASSNRVSAVFANTMDPGAPIVYGFLGATSGNYRASFSIRFAPGPGAVPNALPLPAATIDFAKVEVLNPPYYTKAETATAIREGLAAAASSATNYTDSVASTLRADIASAATLKERGFSEWAVIPGELETEPTIAKWTADGWIIKGKDSGSVFTLVPKGDADSTSLSWTSPDEALANITATRTVLQGYTLGSQTDKPLQPQGDYALLSEVYAAVQQIAPEFDATRTAQTKYKQYELVSKDGVVYQCANTNGHYGAWNASNWTTKKVSELFLPLTGGAMTGPIAFANNITEPQSLPEMSLLYSNDSWTFVGHMGNDIIRTQRYASGVIALLSDIAVKSVELNGTALTPDANGAVNVQALGSSGAQTLNGSLSAIGSGGFVELLNSQSTEVGMRCWNGDNHAVKYLHDGIYVSTNGAQSYVKLSLPSVDASLAPLASPAFTGKPTAPTPASGDNSTKIATTAFVQGAISGISVTPLSGQTFNFATTQGVMDALKTVIEALGGTVTNAPSTTISQGE